MNKIIDCKTVILDDKIGKLKAQAISHMVQRYMQNPENQKEFEKWYLEKYGVPYSADKI